MTSMGRQCDSLYGWEDLCSKQQEDTRVSVTEEL